MDVLDTQFMESFLRMADDGWRQGWHERNGGNLTYRMCPEEAESVRDQLNFTDKWLDIDTSVPGLAGDFFVTTGSGKYFRNVRSAPEDTCAICEIDDSGEKYRVVWGLVNGGRPTSEFPTHLMNHEVKKEVTKGKYRVIYHAHPANLIALTFVLPLTDEAFTRELWEMATECPVVFPTGISVLPWMVPGGREIAVATGERMREYDAVVWAHHGLFCAGEDFDATFGLMHTIEKSAEILVKVLSMGGKRQTIQPDEFRALARAFQVTLPERFLQER